MVSRRSTRLMLVIAYALVAFAFLNWLYAGDSFCGDSHRPSVLLASLRFTLLATSLDFLSSLLVGLLRRRDGTWLKLVWLRSLLTALAVGLLLYFAQDFLFEGYGVFRFEGTPADVSCLLTEGYGMVYPIIVVPAFALLSFGREMLLGWITR